MLRALGSQVGNLHLSVAKKLLELWGLDYDKYPLISHIIFRNCNIKHIFLCIQIHSHNFKEF